MAIYNQYTNVVFLKNKHDKENFDKLKPDFLISVINRYKDCVVIACLIGGGQEINNEKAGIVEQFYALKKSYIYWRVYLSTKITYIEYTQKQNLEQLLEN